MTQLIGRSVPPIYIRAGAERYKIPHSAHDKKIIFGISSQDSSVFSQLVDLALVSSYMQGS